MYVKYSMQSPQDYRGNVALIVGTTDGTDIAYSNTDVVDEDMIELVEDEIELVIKQVPGLNWLVTRDLLRKQLDTLADNVRQSHLFPGSQTIDAEYNQVELALKEWRDLGSPMDDVPDEILVWQEVTGNDLSWVINDIEMQVAAFRFMISSVRRLRLIGKNELATAPDTELQSIYDNYASQLEAFRAVPDY